MTASANDTIVIGIGASITDAAGNVWAIDSGGQITVDGAVDTTTGQVDLLAYANGVVWQKNASNNWYSKTSPDAPWVEWTGPGTPLPIPGVSANDAVVTGTGASVTDVAGNVWAIDSGGQITVDGAVDTTTGQVDLLGYANGVVWQKNASNNWYSKTSPAAAWVEWTGPGTPLPIPDVSANDATIQAGGKTDLIDANGNVWALEEVSAADGYQVVVDGAVDGTTANVVQMTIVNGTVWQENTAGLWYSKTSPAGAWSSATPIDPLSGVAEPVSLTWVGGGNNLASNPADWSPGVAPAAGDALTMGSGTMALSGNALAGDTLSVSAGATVTINTMNATTLDLSTTSPGTNITIDQAAGGTLTLNAHLISSVLNVSGGTLSFIGTSTFDAFTTTLGANLTGTGTLSLYGGNATGESMEVKGSVGSGLAFDISSNGAGDAGLQIDHPSSFGAAITFQAPGYVAFMGIKATQGELLNGTLDLFNGSTLVAKARVADDTGSAQPAALQLQQNSLGVMLSVGLGQDNQPGGIGTVLPLHT
jgi:hypothetical protein